jgi:capsular polysaccharide biosynthesis protein
MRRPDDELDDLLGGSGQSVARPGLPVDPGRLWLSVRRDWRWIPFAGAIWLALALVVAFVFIKHTFKAEAILIWEPQGEGRPDERKLATEAGSMKLPGALRQVKETLKLPVSIETLGRQIDVYFDARSNLVTVEAAGPSRADATRLADGVIAVFLDQQREITRARAGDATKALESDVATARARLQKAVAA